MIVFGNSNPGYLAGKQVFPVDYEAEVSQRLVDAAHNNDLKSAYECIGNPFVDVNFVGTVSLKAKKTEIVLQGELAHQVRVEYEEFKTEVTALFLAAHSGNLTLVRRLLSIGANVNQKLFRGYATTAAVREGHLQILEVLLSSGASQQACEEALVEASYLGLARPAEMLMGSDMIRPQASIHALVCASCRGFVDVVDTLVKRGVDAGAPYRLLLQSSKPSLHTNVDCYALVAAIVNRQINVVRLLLQAGVRTDIKVKLGAWSWDMDTGEDFRVGAGLAEAYCVTWCAVEYFEASGAILRMLLKHISPNIPHFGRTLIHHAIICNNARAVDVLLNCGADVEVPVKTTSKTELRPIHLAARFGSAKVLQSLINGGCNVNSQTGFGETALMICARYKHDECLTILASAGADFGLVNSLQTVLGVIRDGKVAESTNKSVFSSLMFVTRANDSETLKKLVEIRAGIDLDEQDENGFTAAMVAAAVGHLESFKLLVYAGANVKLHNKRGETAMKLSEVHQNGDEFEKVVLEHALETKRDSSIRFYALHRAARRGELDYVRMLIGEGCDVNSLDGEGYTPLMLAAIGGHAKMCELLISFGARCDIVNTRHESALLLARKNGIGNNAERVILDELARKLVLGGVGVKKHTKCGKGAPHSKVLRMVGGAGVLQWGKSSRRNVICRAAEIGPSDKFRWNRRRKFDADELGMFHVVTTKNKEVHFVCEGGVEMAQMWVRGIKLVTRDAIFGKNSLV
ncbi:hypothetical protein FNV43_RR25809 [Rhamnella rubrinervis]|uniref:Uncharacterized protein n=1 Tax=Rhamnella rubrinervis TaxID=2594499 RepID=A0A8K0GLW7_9ROSA|nr:hypothetical protein FNV43_RR25809 [Rhamnella rubrinervis]